MTAIKKIICPVDFSPTSENALCYALRLADHYRAEVWLLHVLFPEAEAVAEVPLSVPSFDQSYFDETAQELQSFSDRVLSQVIDELEHPPVLYRDLEMGATAAVINQIAAREEADLVVMGTHHPAQTSWLFGSVARATIQRPSVPTLIVPSGCEYAAPRHITFATDLRTTDPLHLLEVANILDSFAPVIRCVHVSTPDEGQHPLDLNDLARIFASHSTEHNITFHDLEEDDITEALEQFNIIYHADLQVMIRPRRNFLHNLFHRSQTKRTVRQTEVPLLVVPG